MKISIEARQLIVNIFEETNFNWNGRLSHADFLARIFDLEKIPSYDPRCSHAYADIQLHMGRFDDWETNWIFTDNRFDLINATDEVFCQFLCEVLDPAVRPNDSEIETQEFVEAVNLILSESTLRLVPIRKKYGKPKYSVVEKDSLSSLTDVRSTRIKEYLNSDYVRQQIESIELELDRSPHDAIGKSKELIETICKTILGKSGETADPGWKLNRLVKETNKLIEFVDREYPNNEQAEKSIRQLIGGISSAIHALAELRNNFGSGHGHVPEFVSLEIRHARLCVGFTMELARFYLETLKNETIREDQETRD